MTDTNIPTPYDAAGENPAVPLRRRHPAELVSFLAGIVVIAVALGFNLTEELLLAGLAVVTGLPAIVTWLVNLYRDALRDLG